MNKKGDSVLLMTRIIIFTFLAVGIFLWIQILILDVENVKQSKECEIDSNKTLVLEIVSASAAGLGHTDKCIYKTEAGNLMKNTCKWEKGDRIQIKRCW